MSADRPLRIALVLSASTGGIGRHVASVAPRLVERGHQVRLYCPAATDTAQGFSERGLDVRPLASLPRLGGADVLHAHGFKAGGLALPVARWSRTPLVVTWHNAVLGTGPSRTAARLLQRVVARGATLTLGASSDLVVQARALGARRAELAPVAAPALAPPVRSRAAERRALGADPGDTVVLTVTRLAPQKNLGLLLDIAAAVRHRVDLRFVVVGDGPLRAELDHRVATEGLHVALHGSVDSVTDLLTAADVALLTSIWEARALVAQEALLAGLPLICPRVGGLPELVGEAAVLFELGDVSEAVRELLALADDPARRAALGAAGLRRAATWPDEDDVVDALLASYRRVIAERTGVHSTGSHLEQ